MVQISGGHITELDEEATAAQALIDLEIRRSMREARRQQTLKAEQAQQHADSANGHAEVEAHSDAHPVNPIAVHADHEIHAEDHLHAHENHTDEHDHALEAHTEDHHHPPLAGVHLTPETIHQHLGLMTQQLTAAHRVIGRVSSERDALRQQVADLQGIPVEEVLIAGLSASGESEKDRRAPATAEGEAQQTPSKLSKLNYFGGDDFAQMRRRRQIFVTCLLGFFLAAGFYARHIGWSMPEDVSRDSLAALPVLGNFMYIFLAGWMLYRVVKVSSRGVRWIFPSEHQRRRRR